MHIPQYVSVYDIYWFKNHIIFSQNSTWIHTVIIYPLTHVNRFKKFPQIFTTTEILHSLE